MARSGRKYSTSAKLDELRIENPHHIVAAQYDKRDERYATAMREPADSWERAFYTPDTYGEKELAFDTALNAIYQALDDLGGRVRSGPSPYSFATIAGVEIRFSLAWKKKGQLVKLEKHETWYASKKGMRVAVLPTDKLRFALMDYPYGWPKREWIESDVHPFATLIPEIVEAFKAVGPALKAQAEERKRERLAWQKADFERREAEARARIDDDRWEEFIDLADQHAKAARIAAFIEAIKAQEFDANEVVAGRKIVEWLAWAESRFEAIDPFRKGASGIFRSLPT